MEQLPESLQFLPPDKERERDPVLRLTCVEILLLLATSAFFFLLRSQFRLRVGGLALIKITFHMSFACSPSRPRDSPSERCLLCRSRSSQGRNGRSSTLPFSLSQRVRLDILVFCAIGLIHVAYVPQIGEAIPRLVDLLQREEGEETKVEAADVVDEAESDDEIMEV